MVDSPFDLWAWGKKFEVPFIRWTIPHPNSLKKGHKENGRKGRKKIEYRLKQKKLLLSKFINLHFSLEN